MKSRTPLLLTAAALALAACSGDEPANNLASNEASTNDMASMASDPSDPFGAAEMEMNERMMAATGANASEAWVRKMIEHHRGGIAMSEALLALGGDERFAGRARETADAQRRDMAELERILAGGVEGGSGPANPFQPIETRMHERMMAARGATPGETWARKMIAHHQGAIEMAQAIVGQGGDPDVLAAARRTIDMQGREIAELERMIAGDTAAPAAASPAPPPAPAAAAPAPAPRPKAQPPAAARPQRPAPQPKPKQPEPDPHAGHDMRNMNRQ